MSRVAVALLLLTACGSPLSPGDLEPIALAEWSLAHQALESIGWVIPLHVSPTSVKWKRSPGEFECGGEMSNGCFSTGLTGKTIKWNEQTPQVIRHEAGHAILYLMNIKCWRCISIDGDTITDHGCPARCEPTRST